MKDRLRRIMARHYAPLGRNHAHEREKLMALIRSASPESGDVHPDIVELQRLPALDDTHQGKQRHSRKWSHFMKNHYIKLAVACLLVAVLAWTFLIRSESTPSAYAALTQAIDNSEAAEWVHYVTSGGIESEGWISTAPFRRGAKTEETLEYSELEGNRVVAYNYDRKNNTLRISSTEVPAELLSKLLEQPTFLGAILFGMQHEAEQAGGGDLTREEESSEDKTYVVIRLERSRDDYMQVTIDKASQRVVRLRVANKQMPEAMVGTIDYPETGPADIYELGVPRDAKIVNQIQNAVPTENSVSPPEAGN